MMIPETLSDAMGALASGALNYVLPFLAVIALLVFIHEFGHYFVARYCGVRVETFSIGFGPELFGWNDTHGTRWKVCLVPLGGYVQMFGDTDPASAGTARTVKDKETGVERPMTETEMGEAFFSKSVGKRSAVVFAGPAVNFLFAILALGFVYVAEGKPVTPPIISAVIVDGGGDKAGLLPGDRIVTMNGEMMERFSDVQRYVSMQLDQPIAIKLVRGGQEMNITATPERLGLQDRFGFRHERGLLGILGPTLAIDPEKVTSVNGTDISAKSAQEKRAYLAGQLGNALVVSTSDQSDAIMSKKLRIAPPKDGNEDLTKPAPDHLKAAPLILAQKMDMEFVKLAPGAAIAAAFEETLYVSKATLEAMGQMVSGVRSPQELGGMIRIGAIAGDAAQGGIIAFIVFAAMLSMNLGLINLFPIPMLDGGHLVFYGIEAIIRRPVPQAIQNMAFRVGFVLLIGLMAFANLNDIYQLVVKS